MFASVMGEYVFLVVYYLSIKRELKTRPIYECRYDERLKTKDEESTHLGYTELLGTKWHVRVISIPS